MAGGAPAGGSNGDARQVADVIPADILAVFQREFQGRGASYTRLCRVDGPENVGAAPFTRLWNTLDSWKRGPAPTRVFAPVAARRARNKGSKSGPRMQTVPSEKPDPKDLEGESMPLTLKSADFNDGDYLAGKHLLAAAFGFGCDGGNESPQLSWSGAPEGTKSFAVMCYDPDAPTGSGFWHWVVVDIPRTVTSLATNAGAPSGANLPPGAMQIRTDFGAPGYGGPCPPPGHPHRYIFTLFAVGADSLPLTPDSTAAVAGFMLNAAALEKATLMGLCRR
jgi:Raf kinase inhibitor-like YbhB/YbcL family protein